MSVIRNLLLVHKGISPVSFRLVPNLLSFDFNGGNKNLTVETESTDSWTLEVSGVEYPIEGIMVIPDTLSFSAIGQSKEITIISENNWTI